MAVCKRLRVVSLQPGLTVIPGASSSGARFVLLRVRSDIGLEQFLQL